MRRIDGAFALVPLPASAPGETAERWRYAEPGVAGEIGTISSVTKAFCGDCNRARLSTEGKLFLCLFASRGHDLRALVRGGASDAEIAAAIGLVWQRRSDRYSELRGRAKATERLGRAPRRDALHRRLAEPRSTLIRPLGAADLRGLQAAARRHAARAPGGVHFGRGEPRRKKEPADYLHRLGLDRRGGGQFVLGAWRARRIVGAIGCEREERLKVRHIGHVIGMMVRPEVRGQGIGALLLEACIAEACARRPRDAYPHRHRRERERHPPLRAHGFIAYGNLHARPQARQRYHDKLHMSLTL